MSRFSGRTLAALFVVTVAFAAFFLLCIMPMRTEAGRLSREIAGQRQYRRQQEQARLGLPRLQEKAKDIQAQIASLSRPNANPTPDVVREIERLTKEQGLELTNIHPAEPEYLENSTKYGTSFDAQASFEQVIRLLYELEKSPHYLWVEGVDITGERGGGSVVLHAIVAVYACRSASRSSDAKS